MNESPDNKRDIDNQLANFTDHILNDKTARDDENPFTPDPELRALEQTVLRLKNTFEDGPSESVISRMYQNINKQRQQIKSEEREPFWKKWMPSGRKWRPQQSRQRLSMALYLTALIALMVISAPYMKGISLDQPATSGQNLSPGVLVISGGLILLAIWLIRRKR